jgi:FkbM family methyltransferase
LLKYLIQHAWETLWRDGPITLTQEVIKYLGLYYTPDKLIKWWWAWLKGIREVICVVQGSSMMLNLSDKGIHRDLYLHGIREPQATRYLQSILRPEWAVVDIGANIGYYALQEAQRVRTVIAIEPTPESYEMLLLNIGLNGYKNVRPHCLAVGDHEGEVGFAISRACNWNSVAEGDGDIKVPMTTLDKLLGEEKVDFVRMDVEGYEMNILRGMEGILREQKPRMFLEVHRDKLKDYGSSQREVMEYLARLGYYIEESFIMGRKSSTGNLNTLLAVERTRKEITEQSIASHLFFSWDSTRRKE